jgi:hypothetical protein
LTSSARTRWGIAAFISTATGFSVLAGDDVIFAYRGFGKYLFQFWAAAVLTF